MPSTNPLLNQVASALIPHMKLQNDRPAPVDVSIYKPAIGILKDRGMKKLLGEAAPRLKAAFERRETADPRDLSKLLQALAAPQGQGALEVFWSVDSVKPKVRKIVRSLITDMLEEGKRIYENKTFSDHFYDEFDSLALVDFGQGLSIEILEEFGIDLSFRSHIEYGEVVEPEPTIREFVDELTSRISHGTPLKTLFSEYKDGS